MNDDDIWPIRPALDERRAAHSCTARTRCYEGWSLSVKSVSSGEIVSANRSKSATSS
jgi:hypothetical protein